MDAQPLALALPAYLYPLLRRKPSTTLPKGAGRGWTGEAGACLLNGAVAAAASGGVCIATNPMCEQVIGCCMARSNDHTPLAAQCT